MAVAYSRPIIFTLTSITLMYSYFKINMNTFLLTNSLKEIETAD